MITAREYNQAQADALDHCPKCKIQFYDRDAICPECQRSTIPWKAYVVTINGWSENTGGDTIIWAHTPGKAKYELWLEVSDMIPAPFTAYRARRVSEHDLSIYDPNEEHDMPDFIPAC
jgi:RNA polymerase subunit RPABC4/transcription elongation factor Spt4